jgi:glycosyltransferase involved in cell wall biosynthesis
VAIAEGSRSAIIEQARIAPERVHVIPNARRATDFRPVDDVGRRKLRREFGLDDSHPVVAWVGAVSPEKRPDLAIDVAARLPDIHLLLAGDGVDQSRVARLAADMAPGRVHLLGRTDRVRDVLGAADVLLLTSDSEGVPGVLIEAGLLGMPAVVTDVGFVREVVVDTVTGRVMPRGRADLLAAGVSDAFARRAEMGAAARRHCLGGFELDGVAARWVEVLAGCASLRRMTARTSRE